MKTSHDTGLTRPHSSYWPVVTLLGIVPNALLAGCGALVGVMAFIPSVVYAAGQPPSTFFLLAAALGGSGALNIMALCRCAIRPEPALHRAAVSASGGIVLWAVWLWKECFETYGSLAAPTEAVFLGVIGVLSSSALVWSRWASGPTIGLSLREVGQFAVVGGIFLVLASVIVRPDRMGNYAAEAPIAEHFERLGGSVSWDEWSVTGIYLKTQPVDDDDLEPVSRLRRIRSLYLSDTKITDSGLEHLSSVSTLEHLYLTDTDVSDAGLESIAGLSKLRNLWLGNTAVTDGGLTHLEKMTVLGYLDLGGTNVTDDGLRHLTHLADLYYLHLPDTQVTREGIDWLHERLPRCSIYGTPNGEGYRVDGL